MTKEKCSVNEINNEMKIFPQATWRHISACTRDTDRSNAMFVTKRLHSGETCNTTFSHTPTSSRTPVNNAGKLSLRNATTRFTSSRTIWTTSMRRSWNPRKENWSNQRHTDTNGRPIWRFIHVRYNDPPLGRCLILGSTAEGWGWHLLSIFYVLLP